MKDFTHRMGNDHTRAKRGKGSLRYRLLGESTVCVREYEMSFDTTHETSIDS